LAPALSTTLQQSTIYKAGDLELFSMVGFQLADLEEQLIGALEPTVRPQLQTVSEI